MHFKQLDKLSGTQGVGLLREHKGGHKLESLLFSTMIDRKGKHKRIKVRSTTKEQGNEDQKDTTTSNSIISGNPR